MRKDQVEKRLNEMVSHMEEYKGRVGFKYAKDLGKPISKLKKQKQLVKEARKPKTESK